MCRYVYYTALYGYGLYDYGGAIDNWDCYLELLIDMILRINSNLRSSEQDEILLKNTLNITILPYQIILNNYKLYAIPEKSVYQLKRRSILQKVL